MKEPKQGRFGLWYVDGVSYGFPTREAARAHVLTLQARQRRQKRTRTSSVAKWVMLSTVAVSFTGAVGLWWYAGADERARRERREAVQEEIQRSKMRALQACQEAIAVSAIYGKRKSPGPTDGHQSGHSWLFYWSDGSFYFENAHGVEVAQSAKCEVHRETGLITDLVISGKQIVSN